MDEIETGWMLDDGSLCVGTSTCGFAMVTYTDPNALRFAREWDAENFRHALLRLHVATVNYARIRAVDHQWG